MDGKDKYPKFRSLLAMLESRMTVEGVSLSVAEDLKEVFLLYIVIFSLVQELLCYICDELYFWL